MKNEKQYDIGVLEEEIFEREGVRVVFRLPRHTPIRPMKQFYRALGDGMTVSHLQTRLVRILGAIEFVIVDGFGVTKHFAYKKLGVIRQSYVKEQTDV